MNRPIRSLSIGILVLFAALLLNITYVQYLRAGAYNDHKGNSRVAKEAFTRQRGSIVVAKKNIAESTAIKDADGNVTGYQRGYPGGAEYAPVTGFFSQLFGKSAIESSQDKVLSGSDNRLFTNRLIDLVTNADPKGGNIELTIDPKVQDAAWQGLKDLGDDVEGAAVAIEPSTGRVLAMVTTPSYDPTKVADPKTSKAAWAKLNPSKPGGPMENRAAQTTLPPGSTFKLVTAAAAIQDLGMTPDTQVNGTANLDLPQTTVGLPNENGQSCGGMNRDKVSLQDALAYSCNPAFGEVGLKLSSKQLQQQAEKFGFDQTYLTEIKQNQSVFPSNTNDPQRAQSAIGQFDVRATPLQIAMVSAGIANGGTVMKPYLVDKVLTSNADVLDHGSPEQLPNQPAVSSTTADSLTQMMVNVVQNGTGKPAQISGTNVAGKTGTAQSAKANSPYAWFTGFAPADNPTIAVAVMVQKSGTGRDDIAGGLLCAPIAKAMMEAAIK